MVQQQYCVFNGVCKEQIYLEAEMLWLSLSLPDFGTFHLFKLIYAKHFTVVV